MDDGNKKDSDKDTKKYFFAEKVSQGKKSKRVRCAAAALT
mgnify:CR=1 FL=1